MPSNAVAVNRLGNRAKIKKNPNSAARPTKLSSRKERQVRLAITGQEVPSNPHSDRRGKRETNSQIRRCSWGVESRMGSFAP